MKRRNAVHGGWTVLMTGSRDMTTKKKPAS